MSRQKVVLCIDDDELGLRMRTTLLRSAGYDVRTATSGKEGLRIMAEGCIDCVLLDYVMPDMNGGEVAAELRRLYPEAPIVLYSSVAQLPREVRELANAALMKLDGPEKLLAALERCCRVAA